MKGENKMTNYREEVLRTCPKFETDDLNTKLSIGALGLAGESGEVVDMIKKVLHHGTKLDRDKLIKELGDVRWYLEFLAAAVNVPMSYIEKVNSEKLRARYPDGFSFEAANAKRTEDSSIIPPRGYDL